METTSCEDAIWGAEILDDASDVHSLSVNEQNASELQQLCGGCVSELEGLVHFRGGLKSHSSVGYTQRLLHAKLMNRRLLFYIKLSEIVRKSGKLDGEIGQFWAFEIGKMAGGLAQTAALLLSIASR
jgi:uncharacterized protein (DUF2235 family)